MDSALIEAALGLALIYLILSLSVTSVNEVIQSLVDTRSKTLMARLRQMLDDEDHAEEQPAGLWRSIGAISNNLVLLLRWVLWQIPAPSKQSDPDGLFQKVANDPLIKSLSGSGSPSYIPSDIFGKVVTEKFHAVTAKASHLNDQLQQGVITLEQHRARLDDYIEALVPSANNQNYIKSMIANAEGVGHDLIKDVEKNIAGHFDDVMDRLSGVYAKRMKWFSFWISMIFVVAVNADSINIFNTLMSDDELRKQLVISAEAQTKLSTDLADTNNKIAEEEAKTEANQNKEALEKLKAEQAKLTKQKTLILKDASSQLPIGWECPTDPALVALSANFVCYQGPAFDHVQVFLKQLLGWVISGLAVSLGAPFWFGMLQRLVNIRAVGVKPKRSGEDTPTHNKHTM